MNKNIIKGAERCEDCTFCIDRCKLRQHDKVVNRLEQMVENCISMGLTQDRCDTVDLLTSVIYTLECLGIITSNEADDYIDRLCLEVIK